ncbi:potassium channel family protein [Streptomyces sp. NPDC085946]|uniref:potassium channel family protein n=1 Tax=Streptomyces sp. NPDC085946 TaxID=3365744 RepID=UPI0037D0C766
MSDPSAARTRHPRPATGASGRDRKPSSRRRTAVASAARAVLTAAGLVTAYYLLPLDEQRTGGALALLVCGLLAVLVLFAWEVRSIVRSPHPRLRAVEALAATLALFLVLFAGTYYLLDRTTPHSFSEPLSRTDALYFTLTTFTTVGFGDITARSGTGRVVTMLQMTGGLLLVGGAARVLASAVQVGLRRRDGGPPVLPDTETGPGKRGGDAGP